MTALAATSRFLSAAMTIGLLATNCYADTLEVPDNFPTIQAAIDAAVDGDEVRVAPGSYNERIDYLGKAIVVRSLGGPDVTTINGTGVGNGAVVTFDDPNNLSLGGRKLAFLEGFRLSGGSAPEGAGVFVENGTFSIRSCIIVSNEFRGLHASSAEVILKDTAILSNAASANGGGILGEHSVLRMANCRVEENVSKTSHAFGGGMLLIMCDSQLTDCLISDNRNLGCFASGGGLYINGGSLTLTRCILRDHSLFAGICNGSTHATAGALFMKMCEATITDCSFINNFARAPNRATSSSSEGGGAIFIESGSSAFVNCVFQNNRALDRGDAHGGAIRILTGTLTIIGTQFSRNESDPAWDSGAGGAIWNDAGDIEIIDCSFTRNRAHAYFDKKGSGGAIHGGSPAISDSYFCSNEPDHINAAWIDGGENVFHETCLAGDLDDDGDVDFDDFAQLLASWGDPGCGGALPCPADLDDDGDVDFDDFTLLLANWS